MDAELRAVVARALEEAQTPGCGVGLATPDGAWVEGFGLANVETEVPFTARTRIPIASMTKPYTATAIMALREAGQIDLDAPVRRYLPEFRVADRVASERVTVRHLLTHTAGWPGDRTDMKDPGLERGSGALAAAVASFAGLPQVTSPGALWSYSNAAYMVAGSVIESVCETSYEDAIERLVLQPLGLHESTFYVERAVSYPVAVGHEDGAVVRWPWACDRATNPAGGLISTVADQLLWARWWAGHDVGATGAHLGPVAREQMLCDTVPAGCMCDEMGIGWTVDVIDGKRIGHHEGSLWGIQTQLLFIPEAGIALVTLTNGASGLLVQKRIREHVLSSVAALRLPPVDARETSEARLEEYSGRYRVPMIGRDRRLGVHADAGGLCFEVPGADDGDASEHVKTRFVSDDVVTIVDGALQGLRGEFLRGPNDRIWAVRFGARIAPLAESEGR
jgi:CubicO group peptidase (beta-lactamase class C family)